MTSADRFDAKWELEPGGSCWTWIGNSTLSKNGSRYGQFWTGVRMTVASRHSHERFKGPIPEGFEVDHLCFNTLCVNPDHLEAVTPQENRRRSSMDPGRVNREKLACPRGHPYSRDNTYVNPRGSRVCRTCARDAANRRAN